MKELDIEQLITDDSFINYCLQRKEEDVDYWVDYLVNNKQDSEKIQEARQFVLAVNSMLVVNEKGLTDLKQFPENKALLKIPKVGLNSAKNIHIKTTLLKWVAAAIFFVCIAGWAFNLFEKKPFIVPVRANETNTTTAANSGFDTNKENIYETSTGAQRTVWLPDQTKIILNSATKLKIAKGFGLTSRIVFVDGEALFDVAHDAKIPFVVNTKAFSLKVLGTKFNVKSYNSDKQCEAALIRGKIEIKGNHIHAKTIILKPLQKAIYDNIVSGLTAQSDAVNTSGSEAKVLSIHKKTVAEDEKTLPETAWIFNRIEIVDEDLESIALRLERRYGISITINDEGVKKYRYTAIFENESIEEVLKALAATLPFQYSINNKKISIKK